MERRGRVVVRRRPGRWWRWRWTRIPALAGGLLLIERELVGVVGTPVAQLRALSHLGRASTDPVEPMLAILAFMAEVLVGYVLVVLALRSLSLLPGSTGRLAGRVTFRISPGVVRRLLDLLVGGTLLAQATLTVMPGGSPGLGTGTVHMTATRSQASSRSIGPATGSGPFPACVLPRLHLPPVLVPPDRASVVGIGPVEPRPSLRRSAAPLPPWLGGGPSNPAPAHTVEPGDTLWAIAATHLAPAERSLVSVHRYWQQIYRANRPAIGADPSLIHPGTRLGVPRFRDDRR